MSQAGAPHLAHAFAARFLGSVPGWYKASILGFLVLNPVLFGLDPYVAGWALVLEFIGTLALALRCYPLQPGGLLALEAVLIGMTTPGRVYEETVAGVEVILLLIFMVAGVYFLKELLLTVFTKLVVRVRSKLSLSLLFCLSAALMSAFLDALTVMAVVIAVAAGFYGVYHRVASGKRADDERHDAAVDEHVHELERSSSLPMSLSWPLFSLPRVRSRLGRRSSRSTNFSKHSSTKSRWKRSNTTSCATARNLRMVEWSRSW